MVKFGDVYISDGTVVRSVCRKPPMSPSALNSWAPPEGGEARSLTAVSSRPRAIGLMVNWLPLSQFVRLSVP